MYLIVDCETTGLPPRARDGRIDDIAAWPHVVQLAWALYDKTPTIMSTEVWLIRPDGFTIPAAAERVHHITTERALAEGKELAAALHALSSASAQAEVLVAHNLDFDEKVITLEYRRLGLDTPFAGKKRVCTMRQSTAYCAIENSDFRHGSSSFKWPSLAKLHQKLFGSDFAEAHDASADVAACARCFFALMEKGIITI